MPVIMAKGDSSNEWAHLKAMAMELELLERDGCFRNPAKPSIAHNFYTAIVEHSGVTTACNNPQSKAALLSAFVDRALLETSNLPSTIKQILSTKLENINDLVTPLVLSDFFFIQQCLQAFIRRHDFFELHVHFPDTIKCDIFWMLVFASLHERKYANVTTLMGPCWRGNKKLNILAILLRDQIVLPLLHQGHRKLRRWSRSLPKSKAAARPFIRSWNNVNWPHVWDRIMTHHVLILVVLFGLLVYWLDPKPLSSLYL